MLRIGTSDVWFIGVDDDCAMIRVPVPPSTNARQTIGYRRVRNGGRAGMAGGYQTKAVLVKTQDAREYEDHIPFIRMAIRQAGIQPFDDYVHISFWFTLRNMRYDVHNGLKIMCDVLEKAGLVTDDRYILPQMERPDFSEVLPHLDIGFPVIR